MYLWLLLLSIELVPYPQCPDLYVTSVLIATWSDSTIYLSAVWSWWGKVIDKRPPEGMLVGRGGGGAKHYVHIKYMYTDMDQQCIYENKALNNNHQNSARHWVLEVSCWMANYFIIYLRNNTLLSYDYNYIYGIFYYMLCAWILILM